MVESLVKFDGRKFFDRRIERRMRYKALREAEGNGELITALGLAPLLRVCRIFVAIRWFVTGQLHKVATGRAGQVTAGREGFRQLERWRGYIDVVSLCR
jgi:hypothetical protein